MYFERSDQKSHANECRPCANPSCGPLSPRGFVGSLRAASALVAAAAEPEDALDAYTRGLSALSARGTRAGPRPARACSRGRVTAIDCWRAKVSRRPSGRPTILVARNCQVVWSRPLRNNAQIANAQHSITSSACEHGCRDFEAECLVQLILVYSGLFWSQRCSSSGALGLPALETR
jgi:hypothetical protein